MRIFKLFISFLLCLVVSHVSGATLITPENFSTLQAGTYVSLQCRDTNGGPGWYLNGAAAKSSTFSYANIYQLVEKDGGLALKNVKTGNFVGNTSNLVSNVDEANAVSFEIKNKGIEGSNMEIQNWTTQQEGNVVDNTCRFIITGTSTFLNTNGKDSTPKYATGKGGYSIWYVYTYTAEEVAVLSVEPGIYRIRNEYNGRGELVYNEEYANPQLNNITLSNYDVNNVAPTGNGTYWYIREYNEKVYIFNVEACKFLQNSNGKVTYSETVSNQAALTVDIQTEGDVNYIRFISSADATMFLSTCCGWEPGENQVQFHTHEPASNYLTLIADAGETLQKYAKQVEMANNLIEGLVEIVYNYTFAGEVAKSETFLLAAGSERPVASSLPFACEADYSAVPATLTEAGEYDVPVTMTSSFPFAFSADYDNAAWYTIKMRNGYAGCDGTNFPETNLGSQPSEAKYLYAFQGNPFAFKVLLPNSKYMINSGGNSEQSTFGEEGTAFGIIACGKYVTFTIDGVTGTINDISTYIGFWNNADSYTDANGSKMDIQSVADINVYNIVFAEGAPSAGGVTLNDVTYKVGGTFNAVSSAGELTAEEFTGVEVAGYNVAVAISGRTVTVTYTATKSAAWLALSGLIYEAQQMTLHTEGPWGTDPGFYNQEGVEDLPGAITVAQGVLETETIDDVYEAATTTLAAAVNAAKMIMPKVGKTYQMISAFPTFEDTHGYKMAIYSTDSVMRWMGINEKDSSFFWTVTALDGKNVTFQNLKDGKYPAAYTTENQPIPMTETANACVLATIGDGQFNITSAGSLAPFHAGNHGNGSSNNGNVMIWLQGVNSCSAWYIHEVVIPVPVVSPSDIQEGRIYTISTNNRGSVVWDGTSANLEGTIPLSVTLNATNPNHQFTFIKKEGTTDKFYMVNLGADKFVYQSGTKAALADVSQEVWTIKSSGNVDYPLMIDAASGDHWNIDGDRIVSINDYSNPDDGNCFKMESVGTVDESYLAELKKRIVNIDRCNLITYSSTDNQIVTPTTTIFGDATILSNTYFKSQGVITFDKDLTEIVEEAFSGCENLKSMVLPARVKNIGDSSFEGCSNLSSVNIPDSVSRIGKSAFRDCYCLSSISIPSTVVGIGSYAFKGCSELSKVYCFAKEVPSSVTNIFNNTATNKTLYVHKCAIDTYRSTSPWDVFTSYVNLPYNILLTNIDNVSDDCNLVEGDSYSLTDGLKYLEITSSIPSVNLTYTRNFSDAMVNNWQAWYMPCDFDYEDLSDDFDVAVIAGVLFDKDGQNYVAFRKMTEGTVKAHTPYVVRAKEAGDAVITTTTTLQPTSGAKSFSMQSAYNNFTFGGVYENSYLSAEQPTYALNKTGNFGLMASDVYLRPFRIYMRITDREDNPYAAVTAPQEVKVVVLGEDETDITDVDADADVDGEIYNLAGQKLQKLQKGINIVNGKKVLY